MSDTERFWHTKITDFQEGAYNQRLEIGLGTLQELTAGSAQQSKKMFELNKKAGIANAIVSTYIGAAKALEAGPYIGPALAALIVASGLAHVQSIRATQFQGGGAGTTPSAAGSVPVINNTPVTAQTGNSLTGEGRTGTTINIYNYGEINSNDAERLMNDISKLVNEGDHVLIQSTSRNALELKNN